MSGTLIRGKVISTGGEPVAEARVYFTQAPAPTPDVATLSTEQGLFSLFAPAVGHYQIACAAEGFETATVGVEISGDQPEIEIVIKLLPP